MFLVSMKNEIFAGKAGLQSRAKGIPDTGCKPCRLEHGLLDKCHFPKNQWH